MGGHGHPPARGRSLGVEKLVLSGLPARFRPAAFPAAPAWAGLEPTIAIRLATLLLAVPIRNRLGAGGFDAGPIARLAILTYGLPALPR